MGPTSPGHATLLARLEAIRARAAATPEVVGLLVLGSIASGTEDAGSDLDLGLYVTDEALPGFDLRAWLHAVHPVVAMFETGHAWTAWFADLVRAEVHFGTLDAARDWSTLGGVIALPDAARVVLLDRTGELANLVAPIIGPPPARGPDDARPELLALVDALLVADAWRRRGELAAALVRLAEGGRHLLRLARAAEGATAAWVDPTRRLEQAISPAARRRYAGTVDLALDDATLAAAGAAAWTWALELASALEIGALDPVTVAAIDCRLRPAGPPPSA